MATIVLQTVGSYYGGPVGGAIGAAVGGYIDSNYLLPALFPPKDQAGQKLDSIQLSYYSEGAPFPRGFGERVKNEGICSWLATFRESDHTEGAGKGGGGPTTTQTTYKTDFAVVFCETSLLPGGKISAPPEKIWFDGKLVFDSDPDVNQSSSLITATRVDETTQHNGFNADVQRLLLSTTTAGPNLTELQPGRNVVVSGFTAPATANNGTWRVLRSNGAVGGGTEALLDTTISVTKAATDLITLFQNLPEFDPSFAASFTFYDGSQVTPDPIIVAAEGIDTVPNNKQLAYVVVGDVDLTSTGGRPPNAFQVLYKPDADPTIAQALRLLLRSAGRVEGVDFDVSGVTGNLKGFVQRGPQTPATGIEQIMVAYDVQAQDRDGILTFYDHANVDIIVVADDDLAAHESGSDSSHRDVQVRDDRYRDTPSIVTVTYVDEDNDFQNGSQSFRRPVRTSEQVLSVRLDLTLGADEAQCIARRLAFQMASQEKSLACQLPPSYVRAIENDVLLLNTDDGNSRRMLVQTVDDGKNGMRRYDGVEDFTTTISFPVAGCTVEAPDFPGQEIYIPPEMSLIIMDVAPLNGEQVSTSGLVWAGTPYDSEHLYAGAALFEDPSIQDTFGIDVTEAKARMGYTTTLLGPPADPFLFDSVSSFNVRLRSGTLVSKTVAEVLRGQNVAFIDDEIVGFTTVVLEANGTWTLSGLLRGLADTDDKTSTHAIRSPFVLLTAPGILRTSRPTTLFNTPHDYQLVPVGGIPANYSVQVQGFPVRFNSLRPFAPMGLSGTIDSSNNIVVRWLRRTRTPYKALSGNPLPMDEPVANFELDIYTAGHATLIRTVRSGQTSYLYTSALQTTDGFTPPLTAISVDVFQTSPIVGRSKRERATISLIAI